MLEMTGRTLNYQRGLVFGPDKIAAILVSAVVSILIGLFTVT